MRSCFVSIVSVCIILQDLFHKYFIFLLIEDDNNNEHSQDVLGELENIDDECDALGITFVKIDNFDEAKEYGISKVPKLLYFEKGIPTVYEGNLENEEELLVWLEQQTTSDEIEDITDEMLDLIVEKMPFVAVLYCKQTNTRQWRFRCRFVMFFSVCNVRVPFVRACLGFLCVQMCR